MEVDRIIEGNNCDVLVDFPSGVVDLVVTSPPYDDLRAYGGFDFDFYGCAWLLRRVIKEGGVLVWNVADQTKNGTETGTSWRQCHHFQALGFNIHDTMIYRKTNPMPLNHNRYEQEWEYIFVLSKGSPTRWNPIERPCKGAGKSVSWSSPQLAPNASRKCKDEITITKDKMPKGNIFEYSIGGSQGAKGHPAVMPMKLAEDMITTWTDEGDLVLDPFSGSGTTSIAAKNLGRHYLGIECNPEYAETSRQRLEQGVLF